MVYPEHIHTIHLGPSPLLAPTTHTDNDSYTWDRGLSWELIVLEKMYTKRVVEKGG